MSLERKSVHQLAFGHYLRTGEYMTGEEWLMREERKFNPYHDEIGRFTSPPGVKVSYGRSGSVPGTGNRQGTGQIRSSAARIESIATNHTSRTPTSNANAASARARATAFLDESRQAWRGADDVPNDDRWVEWAKRPARSSLYDTRPPKIVQRIRSMDWKIKTRDGERVVKFSEMEDHLMERSREFWIENVVPPYVREHAVFIYQSNRDRRIFTARMVAGNGAASMGRLKDFVTGRPLDLGQLPQISGHRLVMVEHTHPIAGNAFAFRGFAVPSNSDMYIAANNPGVSFVINQAEIEKFPRNLIKKSFLYFGF